MNERQTAHGLTYSIDYRKGKYVCSYCGRHFPTHYPFRKDGTPNPLSAASAMNNFISHLASCSRYVQKKENRHA